MTLKDLVQGRRVLDVGCVGTSYPMATHKEIVSYGPKYLLGIDHRAGKYPKWAKIARCDVEIESECAKLMSRRAKFEIVLLLDVLEHLSNCGLALENIRAYFIKPGGRVWVRVPDPLSLKWIHQMQTIGHTKTNPDHVHWFDAQTLSSLFGRHGFHAVETVSEFMAPRLEMISGVGE